jgi:hypothetical protein
VNAVAILTVVSFTLHFSGFGGEVMTFGPPGREERTCSRCFMRAKRAKAGSFSLSSSFVYEMLCFGGDGIGALNSKVRMRIVMRDETHR